MSGRMPISERTYIVGNGKSVSIANDWADRSSLNREEMITFDFDGKDARERNEERHQDCHKPIRIEREP